MAQRVISAVLFLAGLPVVIGWAKTPVGMLLGAAVLLVSARILTALATAVISKRGNWNFGSPPVRIEPHTSDSAYPWGNDDVDLYPIWKQANERAASIDRSRWSIELLRQLEWHRFELLCKAYFEALGFRAATTRFGADGGVDISLYQAGSSTPSILVQCKAWNTYKVGIKPVRELLGVMAIEKVAEGALVTTGSFTSEAQELAKEQKTVHLVDGRDLLRKISELGEAKSAELLAHATEGDFTTPTCPSCGIKMTQRESKKDRSRFWGCLNYPRCKQTFSIRRTE